MKLHTLPLILFICILMPVFHACDTAQGDAASASDRADIVATGDKMAYDETECAWSGNPIRTQRYGARAINGTDVWHFRSVEDMVRWLAEDNRDVSAYKLDVVDFIDGKRFIGIHEAVYLHSKLRPSPGGRFLSAVDKTNEHMQNRIYEAYPGPYLSWEEVLDLVG